MKLPESQSGQRPDNKKFFETLRGLSPQARDFLTGLSSQFMEADVYKKFKSDPLKIQSLETELRGLELGDEGITQVMDYFNLPYGKK